MPMTAPLFLESDSYISTLYLINSLSFGVQADVTLYDISGLLLTAKHLYLEPNSRQTTSIKKIISDGGFFAQAGSVEVVSPQNAHALLGQLSITRSGTNKAYLDEELFMPDVVGSQRLNAVIDRPENSPIVALTNVSTTATQNLHVACIPSSGVEINKIVTVQPKQTKLLRACSKGNDEAFSPDAIDRQFILPPEDPTGMSGQGVAGISILSDGPPGEIAAFGFVDHQDTFGRYFSAMNFADPKLLDSTSTVFTGVPVGVSQLLPSSKYTPQVALTNFSSAPQIVSVVLATSTNGFSDQHQVASLTLPANTSKMLELVGINGDKSWQNSFLIHSTGQPGDVVSKMMFKSVGSLPNIELIGKDGNDPHTAGDHPWSVEDGTRSTLFLYNHAQSDRQVTIRIGSGADVWLKIYTLHPGETKAISVNDTLALSTPDMNNHKLDQGLRAGEISWWAPADGPSQVTGRVVQMDKAGTMARNFSCNLYYILCDVEPSQDPYALTVGASRQLRGTGYYCTSEVKSGCNSDGSSPTPMSTGLTWSWSSDDPPIAQITSGASSQTSTWRGVMAGTTGNTISAYVTAHPDNGCSGGGEVDVVPSCPTGITISQSTSIIPILASYVPTYLTGMGLIADMRVQPSTSNFDGSIITEAVSAFSNTCPANIPSLQSSSLCAGTSAFTVGMAGGTVGAGFSVPDIHNQFWDDHESLGTGSRLANSGVPSCTAVCHQTYSCNGVPIANFSITRTFTQTTTQSYPVTFVQVTKQ